MRLIYFWFLIFLMVVTIVLGKNLTEPIEPKVDEIIERWLNEDENATRLRQCHLDHCNETFFYCGCRLEMEENNQSLLSLNQACIPIARHCDGWWDCPDISDEHDCVCDDDEMDTSACTRGSNCSGILSSDLRLCIPSSLVLNEFIYRPKILSSNGVASNLSDANHFTRLPCEGCPSWAPNRCDVSMITPFQYNCGLCYSDRLKCDDIHQCNDSSDEIDCDCSKDEFTCQCYKLNPPTCVFHSACIPMEQYHDGRKDCVDGSDETPFLNIVQCGNCNVTLRRLNSVSECSKIGFPECDSSTCYNTFLPDCINDHINCNKTEVICSSHCKNASLSCQTPFQCSDGSLILAFQFCNGINDCPDKSDEVLDQPGFKCTKSRTACVLPQINLHDNAAQCDSGNDLCVDNSCFQCLDKQLLISLAQVCNNAHDCYDLSDECLCLDNVFYGKDFTSFYCDELLAKMESSSSFCDSYFSTYKRARKTDFFNQSFLLDDNREKTNEKILHLKQNVHKPVCQTTRGITRPTMCDNRPECLDLRDECNYFCGFTLPSYCSDSCNSYFPMGVRYCDGIEDPVWLLINDTACPRGFDERERDCPSRFYCQAHERISIDIEQVFDNINDCDDGSDEKSSEPLTLIIRPFPRVATWIVGCLIIVGNFLAIVFTIKLLRSERLPDSLWIQYLIVLNICFADFLVGIYLLTLASYTFLPDGSPYLNYIKILLSSSCSVIGSLAIVSYVASCLFMVILTVFRLKNIYNPMVSLSISTLRWKMCICFAWLIAVTVAVIPFSNHSYFGTDAVYSNEVFGNGIWYESELTTFACRYAAWEKRSLDDNKSWKIPGFFPEANFPAPVKLGRFGYYNELNFCLPNLLVIKNSVGWEYTIGLSAFALLAFTFIAGCYVIMYFLSKTKKIILQTNNKRLAKQEATMRKRIARIIATNFCCWVPISIINFVLVSDVDLLFLIYNIAREYLLVILLPINSMLNPFLYSSLPDILIKKICCYRKRNL